jgi:hypothetical protein
MSIAIALLTAAVVVVVLSALVGNLIFEFQVLEDMIYRKMGRTLERIAQLEEEAAANRVNGEDHGPG